MDKHTLKANALSQMYSIVSCDWAKITVHQQYRKNPELDSLVTNSKVLLDISVEDSMKELHETLKEYFKDG